MEHDRQRPDGSVATGLGWALVVLGIVAAFMGAGAETMPGWIIGLAFANLAIALGVLLLSLGYLVRAIWFLPGRDSAAPAPTTVSPSTANRCDWCERDLPGGAVACTALSPERLTRVAHKVTDPVCVEQYQLRDVKGAPEHE